MENIDLEKFAIRTDLAFEAIDSNKKEYGNELVDEEFTLNGVKVRKTIISDSIASKVNKKPGLYYSLDTRSIDTHDHDDLKECENALTKIIKEVLTFEGINESHKGLVIGLGNINITPDSLGPLVTDNIIVTRHMFMIDPYKVSKGISNVSALAPGVMGTTGIETFDIITSVIDKIKVDYVMVVDALASKSIERVNKTIQVTNTGISPGSGIGNKRKELSKETVGVPVIAIGVPTVVDAVTIVSDTFDYMLKYLNQKSNNKDIVDYKDMDEPNEENKKILLGEFGLLSDEDKRSLLYEVLTPNGYNMMVTPKEIDADITDLTDLISNAIDRSLHRIVSNT